MSDQTNAVTYSIAPKDQTISILLSLFFFIEYKLSQFMTIIFVFLLDPHPSPSPTKLSCFVQLGQTFTCSLND